ncbi:MAG: GGDEF domain-containing protein, partial [Sulfurimonas sp.]|nr:GGDEF domain-containing protein [Sulfurimonas sp.]
KYSKLLLFEMIFEHSYDAIAIIDGSGRYKWQNKKNREFRGLRDYEHNGEIAKIYVDSFEMILKDELERRSEFFGIFKVDTLHGFKDTFVSAFKVKDEFDETICYVEMKRCAKHYNQILENTRKDKERMQQMLHIDPLTSVLNRRGFYERLEHLQNNHLKQGCIVFADVDNFKKVNDTLGHERGDLVLKDISKIMKNSIRNSDVLARFGGEEFVLWIDADISRTKEISEKIREIIELDEMKVTCSFGVCKLENYILNDAIKNADIAMYKAKKSGKNRVFLYDDECKV